MQEFIAFFWLLHAQVTETVRPVAHKANSAGGDGPPGYFSLGSKIFIKKISEEKENFFFFGIIWLSVI